MEFVEYSRFFAALAFVLGLIGVMALLMRKFGTMHQKIKPANEARLEVLEIRPLDARNKVVLLRRDDVQHLLIAGQDGVRVIERAIDAPLPKTKTEDEQESSNAA